MIYYFFYKHLKAFFHVNADLSFLNFLQNNVYITHQNETSKVKELIGLHRSKQIYLQMATKPVNPSLYWHAICKLSATYLCALMTCN